MFGVGGETTAEVYGSIGKVVLLDWTECWNYGVWEEGIEGVFGGWFGREVFEEGVVGGASEKGGEGGERAEGGK